MAKKMKPLTVAEKKWLEKLEAVLAECPSKRIGAFTVGDNFITLYDRSFDGEIDKLQDGRRGGCDFAVAVDSLECEIGTVHFPFPVHSTAG
ncbi:hypothetical protein ABKY47_002068 [Aeromonas hydrophila]